MIQWINRLLGQAQCTVIGSGGEQLLTRANQEDIRLWCVQRKANAITFTVRATAYRRMLTLRHGLSCSVRLRKKVGLPFWFKRMRNQWGITVGMIVFLLVLRVLSQFAWSVEIVGDTAIPTERLLQTAETLGLSVGSYLPHLETESAGIDLQMAVPELSWAAVNVQGCRILLKVHDRITAPEVVPEDEPCNLVARCNGIITRVQTERGIEAVHAGQTVLKNQMLVSGVFTDTAGETLLFHSTAQIYARTVSEETVTVPLCQTVAVPTGKTKTRIHYRLFGVEIPISLTARPTGENWQRTLTQTPISRNGKSLPLCRICEEWTEVSQQPQILTESEGIALAEAEMESRLASIGAYKTVLEVRENRTCSADKVILQAKIICEENIAEEVPIAIEK